MLENVKEGLLMAFGCILVKKINVKQVKETK